MEWDPIKNKVVPIESSQHLELLQQLNFEIDNYIKTEKEYINYLNYLCDAKGDNKIQDIK